MLSSEVDRLEKEAERLRQENADLLDMIGKENVKPRDCKSCIFFTQHYVRVGAKYYPTCAGHCSQGSRIKSRTAEDKICRYYERGRRVL